MGQVSATFNGLACNGAEFALGWGISPSTGMLTLPSGEPIPRFRRGDLVLTDGSGGALRLRDLEIISARQSRATGRVRIAVADLRRYWRFCDITGEYNIGQRRKKSARYLGKLLLKSLGVRRAKTAALPVNDYPHVRWEYENAARALQTLCDLYGAVVVLQPDASIEIRRLGEGRRPGGSGWKEEEVGVEYAEPFDTVIVRGGLNVYQTTVDLVPVAFDLETAEGVETVRVVEFADWSTLSYATDPTAEDGGMCAESDNFFLNIGDLRLRKLASASVFRAFRARVSLPILDEIVETEQVLSETGLPQGFARRPPYILGEIREWSDAARGFVTVPSGAIRDGFRVDARTGIVEFDQPKYSLTEWTDVVSGETAELPDAPKLQLVCAFSPGVEGWPLAAKSFYSYVLNSAGGHTRRGRVKVVSVPELVQHFFIEDGKIVPVSGERAALDRYARVGARQTMAARRTDDSAAGTFSGIRPLRLDGCVSSVAWAISASSAPSTRFSWNTALPASRRPSYKEKLALVRRGK